jgi:hydrogenase maturation protease
VLVIDALEGGGKPGTIYNCHSSDICNQKPIASLHELGLLSVLEFIPRDRWPDITVLGVQPALIQFGLELSPALQGVLPAVVEAARALTAAWVSPGRTALIHHQSQTCQTLTR